MKSVNMPRYTPELVHYQLGAISTLGNDELPLTLVRIALYIFRQKMKRISA